MFSPAGLSIRDRYSLNTFHILVELYFMFSPAGLSIRDRYSLNTFHILVELYLTLSSAKPPIRDNYILKYIPYPCGTVFVSSAELFNKR